MFETKLADQGEKNEKLCIKYRENKIKFYVIEPHPDDALGSACGICYNDKIITVLHTLCKSGDERDDVKLDAKGREEYRTLRKGMNIIAHKKYMLPDFHYDLRIKDGNMPFRQKIEIYKNDYPSLGQLKVHIRDILQEAKRESAYIAIPMGIEHPIHILTLAMCMECIEEISFDKENVVIYVDHPYDFQCMGTDRMAEVRGLIEDFLSEKLLRCDDTGARQYKMHEAIRVLYGNVHYGEFDGSLERTLCSYYVTVKGYEQIKDVFELRCNNILYISMQAWPFYKTGGLGEVAYGYCQALQGSVNDVRILIPGYGLEGAEKMWGRALEIFRFTYEWINGKYRCEIEKREFEGIIYYLLKVWNNVGELIDFRREDQNGRASLIFCDAVLQKGLDAIDYFPTICHCNDWQTAMIPFLKRIKYRNYRRDLKTVYTIHCYGYKGVFSKKEMLLQMGLSKEQCDLCIVCGEECIFDKIDLLNKRTKNELVQMEPTLMSCMRAGIEFSDAVTTVSRGYAEEIQQYSDFADVRVIGIRNGVIPLKEKYGNYAELKKYKRDQKRKLQEELKLESNDEVPVVCMVARLAIEKGLDLIKKILPFLLDEKMQMIIVGDDAKGNTQTYAEYFSKIERVYRGKFAYRTYSEKMEYSVYSGADILLMPSLSESCGIAQMKAMQFGVVPVVSMLSGFKDTVLDYRYRDQRNGIHLDKGIGFYAYKDDCWVFLEVIRKVLKVYEEEPNEWEDISKTCSETDFSWKNGSVYEYLNLYNGLRNRECDN